MMVRASPLPVSLRCRIATLLFDSATRAKSGSAVLTFEVVVDARKVEPEFGNTF